MLAGFLGEIHLLTANDVETVVSEIKDELGVISKESSPSQDEDVQAAGSEQEPDARQETPSSDAPRSEPPVGAAAPRSIADGEIEARLARLERTLAVVLTLLRRLVRAVEPPEKRPEQVRS
jgi:hypothetical protein